MRKHGIASFVFIFLITAFIGYTAYGQSKSLHDGDLKKISESLSGMLTNPKGHENDWKGPNGSGVIRVTSAFSSTQGVSCSDLDSCDKPCRKYEYTFVGKRIDNAVINLMRSARVCLVAGKWQLKSPEKTVSETVLTPAPPRKVAAVGPTPAELARIKAAQDQKRIEAERKARDKADRDAKERDRLVAESQRQAKMSVAAAVRKKIILQAQTHLKNLYYDVGTPDGALGAQTRKALVTYLADERSQISIDALPSNAQLEQIAMLLDTTVNRQSFSSSCPQSTTDNFVACGFVN